MKTFWITFLALALTFGGLTGRANAQNLSGTWVSPDGAEYTLTHNGTKVSGKFWAGPQLPKLVGTNSLTGGPTRFTGTWESQNPSDGSRGMGTITFTVTNANEFTSITEGVVIVNDQVMPISVTARWQRRGNPAPSPAPGPGPSPAPAPAPELPTTLPPGLLPAPE